MESQVKPDWITDQQWAANPNIYQWERSRKAMQYNAQSKPVTYEEAVEQERRNRIARGEDPKIYDDFLNKLKETVSGKGTLLPFLSQINLKKIIPIMESKDYYKEIVRDYLEQNHPTFLAELIQSNELEETLDYRVDNFLEMMQHSSNPQDEKEVYYKDMLTF